MHASALKPDGNFGLGGRCVHLSNETLYLYITRGGKPRTSTPKSEAILTTTLAVTYFYKTLQGQNLEHGILRKTLGRNSYVTICYFWASTE